MPAPSSAVRDDIVVTGVGAITPLGADAPSTWAAIGTGIGGVTSLLEQERILQEKGPAASRR
jgi:hypothetical protein